MLQCTADTTAAIIFIADKVAVPYLQVTIISEEKTCAVGSSERVVQLQVWEHACRLGDRASKIPPSQLAALGVVYFGLPGEEENMLIYYLMTFLGFGAGSAIVLAIGAMFWKTKKAKEVAKRLADPTQKPCFPEVSKKGPSARNHNAPADAQEGPVKMPRGAEQATEAQHRNRKVRNAKKPKPKKAPKEKTAKKGAKKNLWPLEAPEASEASKDRPAAGSVAIPVVADNVEELARDSDEDDGKSNSRFNPQTGWDPDEGHKSTFTTFSLRDVDESILLLSADKDVENDIPMVLGKYNALCGHTSAVLCVTRSPDSNFILSGDSDGFVIIWELASGKIIRRFKGHEKAVTSVCVTANGKYLITASEDCTVKVWELATGSIVSTVSHHKAAVLAVCEAPDGKQALSGSEDRTTHLWDYIPNLPVVGKRALVAPPSHVVPQALPEASDFEKLLHTAPNIANPLGKRLVVPAPIEEEEDIVGDFDDPLNLCAFKKLGNDAAKAVPPPEPLPTLKPSDEVAPPTTKTILDDDDDDL